MGLALKISKVDNFLNFQYDFPVLSNLIGKNTSKKTKNFDYKYAENKNCKFV